ncbi:uncharacterized protein TNCV_2520711 [Trichonephila clavipes]|nr:uncharacterized protein TNCV_2520711 [Trichonephila clavipes]
MDPQNFVAKLQQHMAELKPLKSPSNRKQNIFVHKDLKSCSHVFLRINRVKKALEPPYEGPYTVQKKYDKYFTILIKDKTINISVDRLKPAYLLAVDNQNEQTSVGQKNEISNWKELSPMPDEQSTTSCGRKIKKPNFNPIVDVDEEANFPIAASVLRNNLYMDDVLCGAATDENVRSVVEKPNLDCFLIKVKVCLDTSYTKRDVLSTIAKIFDPVGLMAPVISKAKIFLQRLWRSKLEWNDLLPAEEYREWQQFLVSLENINNIEIPRRILVAFPEVIEIHGFADASEWCYGAAVYCKSKNLKSETLVRLITSKSRVAPIKA